MSVSNHLSSANFHTHSLSLIGIYTVLDMKIVLENTQIKALHQCNDLLVNQFNFKSSVGVKQEKKPVKTPTDGRC